MKSSEAGRWLADIQTQVVWFAIKTNYPCPSMLRGTCPLHPPRFLRLWLYMLVNSIHTIGDVATAHSNLKANYFFASWTVTSVVLSVNFSADSSHWNIHTCLLKNVSDLTDRCLGVFLQNGRNSLVTNWRALPRLPGYSVITQLEPGFYFFFMMFQAIDFGKRKVWPMCLIVFLFLFMVLML